MKKKKKKSKCFFGSNKKKWVKFFCNIFGTNLLQCQKQYIYLLSRIFGVVVTNHVLCVCLCASRWPVTLWLYTINWSARPCHVLSQFSHDSISLCVLSVPVATIPSSNKKKTLKKSINPHEYSTESFSPYHFREKTKKTQRKCFFFFNFYFHQIFVFSLFTKALKFEQFYRYSVRFQFSIFRFINRNEKNMKWKKIFMKRDSLIKSTPK